MYRKMKHQCKNELKRKMEHKRKMERKMGGKIKGKFNRKIKRKIKRKRKMLNEDCCLESNKIVKSAKKQEDFEYIYQGGNPERWNKKGGTYKDRLLFVPERAIRKRFRRIQEREEREMLRWLELKERRHQMKLRTRYLM
jgi:hypothetical protein